MKHRSIASRLLIAAVCSTALANCGGSEQRRLEHLERGRAYMEEGVLEKARIELKNALRIEPTDLEARMLLGRISEKLGQWREAAGTYLAIIDADPRHIEARIALGNLYLLGHGYDKAEGQAAAVLAEAPDHPEALVLRAAVAASEGNMEAAIADARAALAQRPGDPKATAMLAGIHMQQGDSAQARTLLEQGLARYPNDVGIRLILTQIYQDQGEPARAVETFAPLLEQAPDEFERRLRLARLHASAGDKAKGEALMWTGIERQPDRVEPKLALLQFIAEVDGVDAAEQALQKMTSQRPDDLELLFTLGRWRERRGDSEGAAIIYRELIGVDQAGPHGLRARTALAGMLLERGELDQARTLIGEILEANERDVGALTLRGQLALQESRPVDAIADFRSALKDQPDAPTLLRLLSRAHLANGERELAEDTLEQALQGQPQELAIRQDLVRLLLARGDADAVLAELREALIYHPGDATLLVTQFTLQLQRRDWDGAHKTAERVRDAAGDVAQGHYLLGLVNQGQGLQREALAEFDRALAVDPERLEVLAPMVRSFLADGDPEAALARLEAVRATHPDNATLLNLIGEVKLLTGAADAAIEEFEAALRLDPKLPITHRNLGRAYLAGKDQARALAAYRAGIAAGGREPALVTELATVLEQMGDIDQAVAEYESVLAGDPAALYAANNLAMMLADSADNPADRARALELTERLSASSDPSHLDTVGWVRYRTGDYSGAADMLRKALARAPDIAEIRYHLGMALYGQGEKELARKELQQALGANTEFRGIEEARATLEKL
jgi:tetratricopeptide (TPR) repeat protein